jgi:hypothetical protein
MKYETSYRAITPLLFHQIPTRRHGVSLPWAITLRSPIPSTARKNFCLLPELSTQSAIGAEGSLSGQHLNHVGQFLLHRFGY